MTYHALGAGPGPTKTYYVDLPFPFGNDTALTVPLDQMVTDLLVAAQPRIDAELSRLYPQFLSKFEGSLPDLADQLVSEVQPDVDKLMGRVLFHGYLIGGCLLGGLAYLAWRTR